MKCQNCSKTFEVKELDVLGPKIVEICPFCRHGNY